MIQVLADDHPSQQTHCGHAAIDHCRWDRRRGHCGAGVAGILRADVAMDEEFGWLDIQLFADVFPDEDQGVATFAAGAGFRLMAMLNTG